MESVRALLVALVALFASRVAVGATCDGLLVPDVTSLETSRALAVSFLSTMNWQQYQKLDENGGLDIPGYVKGNYGQTKSNFSKEAHSQSFQWNDAETLSYYSNRVPEARAKDYVDCIRSQHLWIELQGSVDDGSTFALLVHWDAPKGLKNGALSNLKVSPDKSETEIENTGGLPRMLNDGSTLPLTVRRFDPKKGVVISVSGVYGSGVTTAAFFRDPAIPAPPPAPTLADLLYGGNACTVEITKPGGGCMPTQGGVAANYPYKLYKAGNRFELRGPECSNHEPNGRWSNAVAGVKEDKTVAIGYDQALFKFEDDGRLRGIGPYSSGYVGTIYCDPLHR